jgi:hypothetical protein
LAHLIKANQLAFSRQRRGRLTGTVLARSDGTLGSFGDPAGLFKVLQRHTAKLRDTR